MGLLNRPGDAERALSETKHRMRRIDSSRPATAPLKTPVTLGNRTRSRDVRIKGCRFGIWKTFLILKEISLRSNSRKG